MEVKRHPVFLAEKAEREENEKNMNADMKWLDNPEVFRVNQLEAHSDHCYYLDYC